MAWMSAGRILCTSPSIVTDFNTGAEGAKIMEDAVTGAKKTL